MCQGWDVACFTTTVVPGWALPSLPWPGIPRGHSYKGGMVLLDDQPTKASSSLRHGFIRGSKYRKTGYEDRFQDLANWLLFRGNAAK